MMLSIRKTTGGVLIAGVVAAGMVFASVVSYGIAFFLLALFLDGGNLADGRCERTCLAASTLASTGIVGAAALLAFLVARALTRSSFEGLTALRHSERFGIVSWFFYLLAMGLLLAHLE